MECYRLFYLAAQKEKVGAFRHLFQFFADSLVMVKIVLLPLSQLGGNRIFSPFMLNTG